MIVRLPHKFTPRDYQRPALKAVFIDGIRHLYLVMHRRAGKDKLTLQIIIGYLMWRTGLGFYLFPHAVQARKAIWKGRGEDGTRFIDHIPAELIKRTNDLEMSIEFINGSILQLAGSSNIDNLVGSNPLAVAYSEFPLHNPLARQLLSPILAENNGLEILNGTPRGKGPAYEIFKAATQSREWYTQYLTVEDTKRHDGSPVITLEEIESFRSSGMEEEIIAQEFYCSWSSGNVGAFYTKEIHAAEAEQRICTFEIGKQNCFAFWDIGIADATAIWILQPIGQQLRMIYYYEATGEGFEHYARILAAFRERYKVKIVYHFGPHDLAQRQWGSAPRSTLRIAQDCGINFLIVPNVSVEDGIQSVKALFPHVFFHQENCTKGVEALTHYRREYDYDLRTFKKIPLHDWSSHCFTGDTEILTRNGMYRIIDLPSNGEILTKCGWKAYQNPRVTKKNAQLVEVMFKGGYTVRCTPDHMFLTVNGWKSAECLTKGLQIQSSLMFSLNTSMAACTAYGLTINTFPKAVVDYIEMFGQQLLGLFQKIVTFITRTVIKPIIRSSTWNVWTQPSICPYPGIVTKWENLNISQKKLEKKRQSGMDLKQVDCGIVETPYVHKTGQDGTEKKDHANSAKNCSCASYAKAETLRDIAPIIAKPLIIERVKKLDYKEDVWCITVPEVEHFSLSNGAIVHNCADAFRYFAVQWSQQFVRPDLNQPRQFQSSYVDAPSETFRFPGN